MAVEVLLTPVEDGNADVDVRVVLATVLMTRAVDVDSGSDEDEVTELALLLDATGVAREPSGLLWVGQLDWEEQDVNVEVEVDRTVTTGGVLAEEGLSDILSSDVSLSAAAVDWEEPDCELLVGWVLDWVPAKDVGSVLLELRLERTCDEETALVGAQTQRGGRGGCCGGRAREWNVVDDFDAPPRSRLVRVLILLCRVLVEDLDTFDIHGIRLRRWNRCYSTGPCVRGITGIASIPKTKADFHGRLWVLVAIAVSFSRVESTNDDAINRPGQSCRRPIEGIRVELGLWTCYGRRG